MKTSEIVKTLGLGYIDEMISDYRHDCEWLLSIQPDLGPQSKNYLNKVKAAINCVVSDLHLLKEQIRKETQE